MHAIRLLFYGTNHSELSLQALADLLKELSGYLRAAPVGIELRPQCLSDADVNELLRTKPTDSFHDVRERIKSHHLLRNAPAKCVLVCNNDHALVDLIRKQLAEQGTKYESWGIAYGNLAVVYVPTDAYVIWHEILHTLGAKDCYDENDPEGNPGPTCELANCIMQYVPTEANVGEWPFLCEANIGRIQSQLPNAFGSN